MSASTTATSTSANTRYRRFTSVLAGLSAAALLSTGFTLTAPAQAAPTDATDSAAVAPSASDPAAQQAPIGSVTFPGNDGQPHEVGFDARSFTIDGERINIWSGEFHYWRLPSPDHWRDLLQKIRANGFNTVSLYFFWGLHQSKPGGEFDFTGIKDIDRLLTMAEQEGLYVIVRPGPYVNAEISMGGLPAYLTNTADDGNNPGLRTMANIGPSTEWLHAFDQIAKDHQITDGGGSIIMYQVENEMLTESAKRVEFMQALVEQVKADGITVPLFHNDYGMGGRFDPTDDDAAGNLGLDFYAYDNYPLGFNCSAGRRSLSDFEQGLRNITTEGPNFISEAQGGAFSPWGASFGFDQCYEFTDPNFIRQYGVNNIANGVTAFNYYMAFGGTNWGWTGSPSSGYTSYDYGAAITEDRNLTPKFTAQRELGYFIDAVPQLTSMVPMSDPDVTVTQGATVNAYERLATEGKDTSVTGNGTRFLGYRLTDSNDTTTTKFTTELNLNEVDAGEQLEENIVNDSDPRISYSGTWAHDAGKNWTSGSISGDESYGTSAGATATLEFTGSGITLISSKSNNHGKAEIYLDDELVGQTNTCISADSWTNEYQAEPFSIDGLDPTVPHTIEVKVLGEVGCPDNPAGMQGTNVSIDAFKVTPALYTVDDTQTDAITYSGSWETATADQETWAEGDYLGTETFSDSTGDYVEYTFTGTGIQVIAPQSINHGYAEVSIDGEVVDTYSTYNQKQNAQKQYVAFEARGLSEGEHTIRVTVTGEKVDASAGTFVSIDAFNVLTAQDEEGATGDAPVFERIPQKAGTYLTLHGRDALAMVADYKAGEHEMYYSTSQVLGNIPTAQGRLLTLEGYPGDPGETVLHYAAEPTVTSLTGATPETTWDDTTGTLRLNYTHEPALLKIEADGVAEPLLVRVTNREEMAGLWQVDGALGQGNATTQVFGAHLTRTVTYADGVAHLTGSMTEPGSLTVFVPEGITSVTWNGEPLADAASGPGGSITGKVPGPEKVETPELTEWKYAYGTPEAAVGFDDSDWVVADATDSKNPRQGPGPHTGVVLDSNFYHFYEGDVWYRAHYTAGDGEEIVLNANGATGGPAHGQNAASMLVWVNGQYAGSAKAEGQDKTFQVPDGATTPGEPVVLSVLVHNLGQNLDWSDNGLSKQNRGLWDAQLNAAGEVTWKIQGARDRNDPVDSARTLYNNGGLYGERAGWYLPGYPDDSWDTTTNMHAERPGVTWYRTSFDLDVPQGQDTRFALKVHSEDFATLSDHSRAVFFVNGWNTGVWVGDVGPQSQFTIPSGFLEMNGENEIAVAVTAEEAGAGPESIELVQVGNVTGGMPNSQNEAPDFPEYELQADIEPAAAGSGQAGVAAQALAARALSDDGATAVLSGSLSIPALAGDALATVSVDWGDGSDPETLPGEFASQHTYSGDGSYTVSVTATEDVGGGLLAEQTIPISVVDGQVQVGGSGGSDGAQGESDSAAGGNAGDGAGSNAGADDNAGSAANAGDAAAGAGSSDDASSDDGPNATGSDGPNGASGTDGADADSGAAGTDGHDEANQADGGGLPSTGASLTGLGIAALLLAAGALIMRRRHRAAERA